MAAPVARVTPAIAWVGSIVFAAFGLFMGYLLPSENVMQILGPILALLAFGGGLFVPLDQFSQTFQDIAQVTPMYGLNQLVHAPLTGDAVQIGWVVNLLAWLAIFAGSVPPGGSARTRPGSDADRSDVHHVRRKLGCGAARV